MSEQAVVEAQKISEHVASAIIETSPMRIANIDDLDTDALRDNMVKGIYMLESALFNQAGYECNRVNKTRCYIEKLETDLFSDDTLARMEPEDKIALYRQANGNMNSSMKFLQDLHGNIATGIEAMNSIENLKSRAKVKKIADRMDEKTDAGVLEVKQLIMDEIRARVESGV